MPLYEYECKTCKRRTEKIQKFSDPGLTVCPHCAGPLERTLTAPAVHFSGGGWYKDLYSSQKPAAPSAGENAGAAPAASGAGEGTSSSAPAAPSAAAAASAPAAATSSPAPAKA